MGADSVLEVRLVEREVEVAGGRGGCEVEQGPGDRGDGMPWRRVMSAGCSALTMCVRMPGRLRLSRPTIVTCI
jgi:hypothetical protein